MNVRTLLMTNPILLGSNFFSKNIFRSYAFKSDLKIKWTRPEKIPCYKPEKSGDLEGIPNIDKKKIIHEFSLSKELESADENVKKLFTLEFAPKKYTNRFFIRETVKKVQRHNLDFTSSEVKIAKWTGVIRALQEVFERFPHDKRLKVNLKELIDKRKKRLKLLRIWDYKRFEWLLETLDIVYKPPPNEFIRVTRKESLQKLTNEYCDDIKQQRLDAYRLQLENAKPAFLEEKIRALQFIKDEQKECGIEVTVTDEEINEARKQLQDIKKKSSITDD